MNKRSILLKFISVMIFAGTILLTGKLNAKIFSIDPAYEKTEEGNEAYLKGNYEESLKYYLKAKQKSEDLPQAWLNLGNAYWYLNKIDESLKSYENALKIDTSFKNTGVALPFNLGNAYVKKALDEEMLKEGQSPQLLQQAIEMYQKALSLDSTDNEVKTNLELTQDILARLVPQPPQPQSGANENQKDKHNQDSTGNQQNQQSNSDSTNRNDSDKKQGEREQKTKEQLAKEMGIDQEQMEEFLKQLEEYEKLSQNYFQPTERDREKYKQNDPFEIMMRRFQMPMEQFFNKPKEGDSKSIQKDW